MTETPNFSIDLTGQTAFITGTTSGLGRRFAEVLASCGANVAVAGRRVDRLEELAEHLKNAEGKVLPVPLDVTDTEALFASVEKVEQELGPIQILV
ncbi:MAG: SDR family NAD(P)-dependent oxidoreductase, partial [Acidimicrobiales bacterium]|nr:SDR family NAD(P)-dependent oxidoreductase [Acidimicrobiales bacterium]